MSVCFIAVAAVLQVLSKHPWKEGRKVKGAGRFPGVSFSISPVCGAPAQSPTPGSPSAAGKAASHPPGEGNSEVRLVSEPLSAWPSRVSAVRALP